MPVPHGSRRVPARCLYGDAGANTDDAGDNTDDAGDNTDDPGAMTRDGPCIVYPSKKTMTWVILYGAGSQCTT